MSEVISSSDYERETYYLGQVTIEPRIRKVTSADGTESILSGPKISALATLAQHHGETVTRDTLSQILSGVSTGFRDASTLGQHIKELRLALGDNAKSPKYIGTIRAARNANKEYTKEGGFTLLEQPTFEAPILWEKDPYLGLRTFEFDHNKIFFGRSAATNEIIGYLHQKAADGCAFILVHGVSGAGKSSVVRAGVLPELCKEQDHVSGEWRHAVVRARAGHGDLFDDLAEAIVKAYPEILEQIRSVHFIAEKLRDRPHASDEILRKLLDSGAERNKEKNGIQRFPSFALVADQMEELFATQTLKNVETDAFVLALDALARSGWCYVIGTIRSDFLQVALRNRVLAKMAAGSGVYTLSPPTVSELRAIIRGPLKLRNLTMEESDAENSLSDLILQDALPNLESLAVLGFTLSELYAQRTKDDVLSIQAYRDLGGLQGCLARRAEKVLRSLTEEAQRSLNGVLTRLATVDRASESMTVARAADWNDVTATSGSTQLVKAFRDAHLFSVDRSRDGKRVVRVAHEAVLTTWKRAQKWMMANRQLLAVHVKVARCTLEWIENSQEDSLLLTPGLPLIEGKNLADSDLSLTSAEALFIQESLAAETAEQALQLKRQNLTKGVAIVFAVLTLLTTALGLLARRESESANYHRTVAEQALEAEQELSVIASNARDLAVQESELARSTLEEFVEMFRLAGPDYSGGKTITAVELLDLRREHYLSESKLPAASRAEILDAMGRAYTGLAKYDEAIRLLEKSLDLRKQANPIGSVNVADAIHQLAWTNHEKGNRLEAVELGLVALRGFEELKLPKKIASTCNSLGLMHKELGEYDKSVDYYNRALQIKEPLLGSNHEDVFIIKGNIGQLLINQGKIAEAEPYLLEAFEAKRAHYSQDSPKLAYAHTGLGSLYQSLNRLEEAQFHHLRALQIRRRTLREDHWLIALSMNNLGWVEDKLGNSSKAIALLEKAVELGKRHKNKLYLAVYQTNFAEALLNSYEYERARKAATQSLEFFNSREKTEEWRLILARTFLAISEASGDCLSDRWNEVRTNLSLLGEKLGVTNFRLSMIENSIKRHCPQGLIRGIKE